MRRRSMLQHHRFNRCLPFPPNRQQSASTGSRSGVGLRLSRNERKRASGSHPTGVDGERWTAGDISGLHVVGNEFWLLAGQNRDAALPGFFPLRASAAPHLKRKPSPYTRRKE